MRVFLLAALILLYSEIDARDIDGSTTGSWYKATQSGHGFSVEILPDGRAVIYWYVYNPDGTPTFLVAIGNINGDTVHADVYHQTGMPFGTFDNSNLVQMHWGTLDFTLNTCDSATLSYNSTMSIDGQPFGSGSIQLSRLSSVSGLKCTTNFLHGNVSIVLVDPTGEVGFGAGLLFGNGDVAMYALGTEGYGVLLGTWQQSGTEGFRIDATLFYADGGTEDVTATGTFGDDGFVGSYTGGGSVRATWLRSFQFDLTYQQLAGNYSIAHPTLGQIGSASVATNGHVTGNTIDGCVIVGDFVIPDTRFKQAYFEGDISNCASAGSIVGAAIYEHVQNTITVIGTDGFYGSFLILN